MESYIFMIFIIKKNMSLIVLHLIFFQIKISPQLLLVNQFLFEEEHLLN